MKKIENETIGSIVAGDYRTAAVFEKFGIDFCCKGGRTVGEACETQELDIKQLEKELRTVLARKHSSETDYNTWPLDMLANYIEKKHHRYVSDKIPELTAYLEKLCQVHGNQHPELFEILSIFSESGGEFTMHMKKEEMILFPFIRKMVQADNDKRTVSKPHFGSVQNPIQMMMAEHQDEGEQMQKIAELSQGYTPPEDACNTYRVTLSILKEFEDDLHRHIHLENNILFPKAEALEKRLTGA